MAEFAPVRVTTGAGGAVLLAPGESDELAPGEASATVEIPGYESLGRKFTIPPDRGYLLQFDTTDLIPDHSAELERSGDEPVPDRRLPDPKAIGVKLSAWAPVRSGQLPAITGLLLTKIAGGLAISRASGSAQPVGVELATSRTPRRLLAIPPVTDSESTKVAWYLPPSSVPRPRVEPSDAGGRLLMEYLLGGRYALAAATARAVAAQRGAQRSLDWSVGSYTQLLIGYSYALGGDSRRLAAWCRRTAAAQLLGTDGLVLVAEAAWQQGHVQECRDLLARAAGSPPPTVTCGAEMGYRRASFLAAVTSSPEPDGQDDPATPGAIAATGPKSTSSLTLIGELLQSIRTDWLRVLVQSDSQAATISVPETGNRRPDLAAAGAFRRLFGKVIFYLTRLRYDRVMRRNDSAGFRQVVAQKGAGFMEKAGQEKAGADKDEVPAKGQSSLSKPATIAAFVAVAAWLGFSFYLLTRSGATNQQWTRMAWVYGSVQSVAFGAAAALFGTTIQQNQVKQAEGRAQKAHQAANENQADAVKGRALAASIQADAAARPTAGSGELKEMGAGQAQPSASDEVRQKHAQLAMGLFGDQLG